jgi:peptidoglycan/LPS O-acetylase OafA/YrhL
VLLLLPKLSSWNPELPRRSVLVVTVIWLANISYCLYLLNLTSVQKVLLPLLMNAVAHACPQCDLGYRVRYAAYWVICLVAGTLLYRYFEQPLGVLRDRWSARRGAVRNSTAVTSTVG